MSDQLTADDVEEIVAEATADLREEVEELRRENEQLRDRVDDLEDERDERATLQWDSGNHEDLMVESTSGTVYPLGASLDQKLHQDELEELRDRLDEGDLAGQADAGAGTVETETPLEDVVALPEDVADQSLSPNQDRARFIASDVVEYGDKVPAGRRLTAGRIGKILRAGRDVDPHPETVARVMAIVDDLGGDGVTKRKKNGEKRIIVDDDLAARLERLDDVQAHDAMSGGTA
jgi:hypothetical protein